LRIYGLVRLPARSFTLQKYQNQRFLVLTCVNFFARPLQIGFFKVSRQEGIILQEALRLKIQQGDAAI